MFEDNYTYTVKKEGDLYISTVKEFPGIMCHGYTEQDAEYECKHAVRICLDYLDEYKLKRPIPQPSMWKKLIMFIKGVLGV